MNLQGTSAIVTGGASGLRECAVRTSSRAAPKSSRSTAHARAAWRSPTSSGSPSPSAPQLPRDRRRRPTQTPSGLPNAHALNAEQGDLLALLKRQVPTRQRVAHERRHPATLSEPSAASRRRRPDRERRVLAALAPRDLLPEQPLHVAAQRRPPRRLHRRPARQLRHPPSRPAHRNPSRSGVATTG